jgi:hypothetical protein
MGVKTSRLQPGFSACELMTGSIFRETWPQMVETSLEKPAEAGSILGVWALPSTSLSWWQTGSRLKAD